ncbi:MAG: hypothetical protein US50_C0001G0020 [Candidatus Nomurabacteria bacterium GW2011_GWB1_37_5]|uniref:DoxX family protein n=1 Tax=Candidatus Nomurabacteria bacterium GW2011_GWB1_37_5 TaxID=1618742 RepID=A0A0G0GYF4_9BACT|nr:MAG: hypothetical protein US50_C0001G0020 [Candidatus Nomurabacteria bacterium GW2011_GWB1_37_5]
MPEYKIEILIARLGLAFPFIYAAIASYFNPDAWIGFFPSFITNSISSEILLGSWAIFQIIIALCLIIGKKILIPSIIAALMLTGILIFNIQLLDIIFRDVSILASAIVLVIISYKNQKR